MAEVPKFVPLPDVPEYTDEVVFGALGLPVGFDEERLQVNLRAFNRVKSIAGLGRISISRTSGAAEQHDMNIGSLDSSGAATVGLSRKRTQEPLGSGNITWPTTLPEFGSANTKIKLDGAEADSRITESKSRKGAMDPNLQAKLLNGGIKTGLYEASMHANFNKSKAKRSFLYYGGMNSLILLGGTDVDHIVHAEPMVIALGPIIMNLVIARYTIMNNIVKKDSGLPELKVRDVLKAYRQSIFVGCAPDRYLGAAAVTATSRFVKARA